VTAVFVVAAGLTVWALKAKTLKGGSLAVGVALGLLLVGTPAGPPLAGAMHNAGGALQSGVVSAFRAVTR
jgi:hypothetical protein